MQKMGKGFVVAAIATMLPFLTPHSYARDESVSPIGTFLNVVATGRGFLGGYYLRLWKHKGSAIGVITYHHGVGASKGILRNVSYSERGGKLTFESDLSIPCAARVKDCTPSKATLRFSGVRNEVKDAIAGTMTMLDAKTGTVITRDEVVLSDSGGGYYPRFESYDKWLIHANEILSGKRD